MAMVRDEGSCRDVAPVFGLTPNRVYHICRKHGLSFGANGTAGAQGTTSQRNKRIIAAAWAGATVRQIAGEFDVSPTLVRAGPAEARTSDRACHIPAA